MEEVINLAVQLFQIALGNSKQRCDQITDHRHRARLVCLPIVEKLGHLVAALLPDQEIDHGVASREQFLDEALADKAGGAGDEVSHRVSPQSLFVLDVRGSLAPH